MLQAVAYAVKVVISRNYRTWADAQRDGRRVEYRWRRLLNDVKFG